jgi:hypothetical protein
MTELANWTVFEREAPEFAAAGRRLMVGDDGVAIAFLATSSSEGQARQAPVCPIFCGDWLYLSASGGSPKVRDLREGGRFSLHAFLGENDEEFQLQGSAVEVEGEVERAAVHAAIAFPAFEANDPIFRLEFERAVWVYWEKVGQPDTRAVRKRWVAAGV